MKYIILRILQWSRDPSKYMVADARELFENAPEFSLEWRAVAVLCVLSPLYRPIPPDYELYLAQRNDTFPYNTQVIWKEKILFATRGSGVFFLASAEDMALIKKVTGLVPTLAPANIAP